MEWYNKNKNTKDITLENGFIIINAKENILASMAGTIASILSKSNDIKKGTFVMSLARNPVEETTKVSLRVAGRDPENDLRKIVDKITQPINGSEAGGHKEAAGAIVPTEQEDTFIEEAKRVLRSYTIEEKIE
jgi:nanoRNase/pAp phosphatase (c-di-AMP/oligoRNAs hydrolase)